MLPLLAFVVLTAGNAFFVAAEFSLVTVDRAAVEAQIAALQVEFAALEDEGRVSTSEHDARSVVMQTERDAAASRRGADTAASSSGSKQ